MKISLDIETACGVGCTEACDHALDPYRNRITVIGAWDGTKGKVFRNLQEFAYYDEEYKPQYVGFNLKFDLHVLKTHEIEIPLDRWEDDVQLMATAYSRHVKEEYLEQYEINRREANKFLPKGKGHRVGRAYSLKVLAPYFLGVPQFWETPDNHDNDEYVLKDAEYTWRLVEVLEKALKDEGSYEFYKEKLFNWNKLLYKMEVRGIEVDVPMIKQMAIDAENKAVNLRTELDRCWDLPYREYRSTLVNAVAQEYRDKCRKAQEKRKNRSIETDAGVFNRYEDMCAKAIEKIPEKMNIDSPAQIKWILQDYYKLDVKDFDDEESTGKAVLKRLATGRADIQLLLDYREQRKLSTSFFPSYLEMQVDGTIHASFRPFVARTGRLSSSSPNLQQVARGIHHIFKAREGYKLITKDESAIEPRLIAYAAECPVLYEIFDRDLDYHGYNTKIFFNLDIPVSDIKKQKPLEREVGKEVGLAIKYGAGGYRLQESAQKRGFEWPLQECKDKVWAFRDSYEAVYDFKESLDGTLKRGGLIRNLFGRPFRIDNAQDVHMQGMNTLIQGSASDLVLHSAWKTQEIFEELNIDAHVLLLVHDEIVVECHNDYVDTVEKLMDDCMTEYKLETKYGLIKLKTEGKVSDRWEK